MEYNEVGGWRGTIEWGGQGGMRRDHKNGTSICSQPPSDFINASFVAGGPLLNTFICAQGPLPETIADFWAMVWQEKAGMIVMLCAAKDPSSLQAAIPAPHRDRAEGRSRAAKFVPFYWPRSGLVALSLIYSIPLFVFQIDRVSSSLRRNRRRERGHRRHNRSAVYRNPVASQSKSGWSRRSWRDPGSGALAVGLARLSRMPVADAHPPTVGDLNFEVLQRLSSS